MARFTASVKIIVKSPRHSARRKESEMPREFPVSDSVRKLLRCFRDSTNLLEGGSTRVSRNRIYVDSIDCRLLRVYYIRVFAAIELFPPREYASIVLLLSV